MDREKIALLLNPKRVPDPRCADLFFSLLSDEKLMTETGGQFLTSFESVQDSRFAHRYQALWEAREKILRCVAERHRDGLFAIYTKNKGDDRLRAEYPGEVSRIKQRSVKNTCLGALARLDTPDIHRITRKQFDTASSATDRLIAFSLILDSTAPDRLEVLDSFEKASAGHPVSWENFLATIAGSGAPDVSSILTRIENSGNFRIEQANDQRALYGRFAMNRKSSLQTEDGRVFLERALVRLAGINEFSTVNMLHAFDALDNMEEEYHAALVGILLRLVQGLDPKRAPSVYHTARRILDKSPLAVENYQNRNGPFIFWQDPAERK